MNMNSSQTTQTQPTFIFASIEPKMLSNVTQQLKTFKGITWFAPLSGRFDLCLQLQAANPEQIYELVNRVRAINGVQSTQTYMPFEGYTNGKNFESSDRLALVLLNARESAPKLLQTLRQLPYVYGAFTVPGEFDVLATVHGKNYEEIFSQVLRLAETPGISNSETLFAYSPTWA